MSIVTNAIVEACKQKLLKQKQDLLNSLSLRPPDHSSEPNGDSADQTVRVQKENEWITMQSRFRAQLVEIEAALAHIERGNFGVCEETGMVIEPRRLMTIPWTRLSVEGAMARELDHH
jgi:DnaK suppressor protein